MLVGVIFKDEWLDIVLPADKVKEEIIKLLIIKKAISREKAKAIFNQYGQEYFEKKFAKEIKKKFVNYINNEVTSWFNYDEKLKKLKRNKNNV